MYPNNLQPSTALEMILKESYRVINDGVDELYLDLIKSSPKDTGQFQKSWDKDRGYWTWTITNSMEYGENLALGRRKVNGKYYGSLQWENGIAPYLQTAEENIEEKLDKIRY